MSSDNGSSATVGPSIDRDAQPRWLRTGYKFFPYAARQSGQWWVLRLNHGFPEHDMFTVFVDGKPAADCTGSSSHSNALIRSVAALRPFGPTVAEPMLDTHTAAAVVRAVAPFAHYGSEVNDPCIFCEDHDGLSRGY